MTEILTNNKQSNNSRRHIGSGLGAVRPAVPGLRSQYDCVTSQESLTPKPKTDHPLSLENQINQPPVDLDNLHLPRSVDDLPTLRAGSGYRKHYGFVK